MDGADEAMEPPEVEEPEEHPRGTMVLMLLFLLLIALMWAWAYYSLIVRG